MLETFAFAMGLALFVIITTWATLGNPDDDDL